MFAKYLSNIKVNHLTIKFHVTINEPLSVLPDNGQDLGHQKTYLFYQDQPANAEKS